MAPRRVGKGAKGHTRGWQRCCAARTLTPVQPCEVVRRGVRSRRRWAGGICFRNGVVEETGLGAGVLDDPVMGVVWLANRLQQIGVPLTAGETILAGSFTRPVDCRAGDRFVVDFGRLGIIELDVT